MTTMPPRKKPTPVAPSTMKELKDTLWKAADKLPGSMDASQYKDVILGLVFLKYVSDAYDERRAQIDHDLRVQEMDDDQVAMLIDDTEEDTGYGVFVVPRTARWSYLAQHAKGLAASMDSGPRSVGELIDDAVDLVMGVNPALAGTVPRILNRDNVHQRRGVTSSSFEVFGEPSLLDESDPVRDDVSLCGRAAAVWWGGSCESFFVWRGHDGGLAARRLGHGRRLSAGGANVIGSPGPRSRSRGRP